MSDTVESTTKTIKKDFVNGNSGTGSTTGSNNNNNSIRCYDAKEFPEMTWFDETISHPAISVPAKDVAHRKKQLKRLMLHDGKNVYLEPSETNKMVSKESSSQQPQQPQRRVLIMNVGVTQDEVRSLTFEGDEINDNNNNNIINNNNSEVNSSSSSIIWIDSFPITRGYYDMSVDEVLRKLLSTTHPVHEIPSSFELVGHIAHVNLRDDCLPYKYWIGRVILDLNQPTIQTVVNKVGTIDSGDSVFRTFQQEVIAGNSTEPDWSVTTVHEHGCCFQLDFRNVYWNSRLSGEHHRLVQLIQKSCRSKSQPNGSNQMEEGQPPQFVVVDLMAGVGPFAIPLTTTIIEPIKKTKNMKSPPRSTAKPQSKPIITVYANDLNPSSTKFLEINSKKNKCTHLHCSNFDARELLQELQAKMINIDHVIMNLPASAPEFLDAFRGWKLEKLPIIHVYCFGIKCKDEATTNNAIIDRCTKSLGCLIDIYTIVTVRNISPTKNMFCISFALPNDARNTTFETISDEDRRAKKQKHSQL